VEEAWEFAVVSEEEPDILEPTTLWHNSQVKIYDSTVLPILEKKIGDYRFLMVVLFACFIFIEFDDDKIRAATQLGFIASRLWIGLLLGSFCAGALYLRTSKLLNDAITQRGLHIILPDYPEALEDGSDDNKLFRSVNDMSLGGWIESTLNWIMLICIVSSAGSFLYIVLFI